MSQFLYTTMRRVPMHRLIFNLADALLYSACWYASGLCLIGVYYPQASNVDYRGYVGAFIQRKLACVCTLPDQLLLSCCTRWC